MVHTLAGNGISDTDLVGCVTALDKVVSRGCQMRVPGRVSICITWPILTFLDPQEAVLPGCNPPWRG